MNVLQSAPSPSATWLEALSLIANDHTDLCLIYVAPSAQLRSRVFAGAREPITLSLPFNLKEREIPESILQLPPVLRSDPR